MWRNKIFHIAEVSVFVMSTVSHHIVRARAFAAYLEHCGKMTGLDRKAARALLSARYGIAQKLLWSLRYDPPKSIASHVYHKLCSAVEAEAMRQISIAEGKIREAREGSVDISPGVLAKHAATLRAISELLEGEQ